MICFYRRPLVKDKVDHLDAKDAVVLTALEVISKSACRGRSIDDISAACDVSRRTLERKFARQLGVTVKHVIISQQIARAKQLLEHTDYTLAHIAKEIGLNYAEGFCHMFKRETGMTPGDYRKLHKGIIPNVVKS